MDVYSCEIVDDRPILMCEICMTSFHGEDDVTEACCVCGREGFCRDCAEPWVHDCEIPAVETRRPLVDGEPDGYQESDRDYVANNLQACVWFLENYDEIKRKLES